MDNLQADELSVEEGISLQLLIFEQFSSLSRELNKKDKHESCSTIRHFPDFGRICFYTGVPNFTTSAEE